MLLAASLVVPLVSGIAIRSVPPPFLVIELSLSEPAILGVPTNVSWTVPNDQPIPNLPIHVVLRTKQTEYLVGSGVLYQQQATIFLPCEATSPATVLLRGAIDQQLFGQKAVNLLPAGAECVLR